MPAEQSIQLEALVSAWYLPAPHPVHLIVLEVEYLPARHCEQPVAPVEADDYPAEQGMQGLSPGLALYVPTGQLKHADEPVENEYCPASHGSQPGRPAVACILPTPQLEHATSPAAE